MSPRDPGERLEQLDEGTAVAHVHDRGGGRPEHLPPTLPGLELVGVVVLQAHGGGWGELGGRGAEDGGIEQTVEHGVGKRGGSCGSRPRAARTVP